MSEAKFLHYELKLLEPSFGSQLTDLIIELDYLRRKPLGGSTHPKVFFQLKHIFHTLESIGSARIEGNNTTIAEYIETKLTETKKVPPGIKEIQNIEKAMAFIETTGASVRLQPATCVYWFVPFKTGFQKNAFPKPIQ
jgi:Fic family protein